MRNNHRATLGALLLVSALAACGEAVEGPSGAGGSVAALTTNGVNATMSVDAWGGGTARTSRSRTRARRR